METRQCLQTIKSLPQKAMAVSDSFLTVLQPAQGLYKEKGSKFISYIYPILEESQVRACIDNLRKEHAKARHICYAYRFGPDPDYHRLQDDGEPNGSAGLPILSQLKSHTIHNALIVVVRYFGGVLLGVSGLNAAYKLAAVDAISKAMLIERTRFSYFILNYSYSMDNKIKTWLKSMEGKILGQDFMEHIHCRVSIPLSLKDNFILQLRQEEQKQQWHETIDCQWIGSDQF